MGSFFKNWREIKSLFLGVLLSINIFIVVCYGAPPQENLALNITFEMDGKLKRAPKFIEFRTESGALIAQPEIKNGRFNVPAIALREPVTVIFQFLRRRMVFSNIFPIKFKAEAWKVEIKHPPFDPNDDLFNSEPKKPKEAWFVNFNDGTYQAVLRFEKK
jgi:hypothetical protein